MVKSQKKNKRPQTITLSGDSVIKFFPLTRVREPDGRYYIGRESTSTYLHLKEKYAEIIRLCDGKRSLHQVVELYTLYNNLPINEGKRKILLKETLELIEQLIEYKFIHYIDEQKLGARKRIKRKKSFDRLSLLDYVFSNTAFIFYFGLFFIGFTLSLKNPALFPRAKDIFWHNRLVVSLVTQLLVSIILLTKHELAHLLSAANFGATGDIYLSRRIFFLVAETRLDDIYKLPRKKRAKIYLSGLASDAAVYGISIILLTINGIGPFRLSPQASGFIKQVIVLSWLAMIWQFRFFMRTDIYALIEDYTGCDELLDLAKTKINYLFLKVTRFLSKSWSNKYKKYKKLLEEELYTSAQSILSWYVWFVLIGVILTFYQFFVFEIPISLIAIKGGWTKIILGYQGKNRNLIYEGNIVLFIQLFYWGLLTYVILRDMFSKTERRWDENITREVTEDNLPPTK